jgi:hypothetical protein
MKRVYQVGALEKDISLAVSVGSAGIAYTEANKALSGGQKTTVAQSTKTSGGSISPTVIGTSNGLQGSYLIISTGLDFGALPQTQWAQALKTLSLEYTLCGGFSGTQAYNADLDDVVASLGGKLAMITKPIKMV